MSEVTAQSQGTPSADPVNSGASGGLGIPDAVAPANIGAGRMARALAKLSGKTAAEPAAEPPAAEEPSVAAAAESVDAPAAEPVAAVVPEQKPGESDAKFEARLAKAMADLTRTNATLLQRDSELKAQAEAQKQLQADMAALNARLSALKGNPLEALKAAGTSFDELTKQVLEGKVKAPTAEDELRAKVDESSKTLEAKLAELQSKIDAAEAEKAEQAKSAEQAAIRARDLETVKGLVTADKYPLSSALPYAPERVLQYCYEHETGNVAAVAAQYEQDARKDLESVLLNQQAVAALLKQPKIRETIQAALGPSQSRKNPVSSEGPRVLAADVVSAPTTPIDRPMTPAERMNRAKERLYRGEH